MKRLIALSFVLLACGGPKTSPDTTPPPPPPGDGDRLPPPPADPAPPPVAVPTGKPKADLIPRSVLFGNPERAGVQLSPDGKHLSWLAPKDGVLNIWVAPVGKLDQARVITQATKRPIHRYVWAYTSQHVLYQQDNDGDENFHVFRVDLADAKVTDLTPWKGARVELFDASPKRPKKILVQANDRDPQLMDVLEIDLATGTVTRVLENKDGFIGFTVDHDGKVRFGQKRTPAGATEIHERVGSTWKLWDTVPFEDAESTGVLGFAPGGKAVYMNESRGRDTGALVELDLKTKKQVVLAEDPKADLSSAIGHPMTQRVQAVAFEYDRIRWQVLDKAIEKDLAAIAKLDGGEARPVTRTLDDKTWLVATTSEQKPGRYYLWDRGKQKATFLFAVQPELEKQPLVKMHPVVIKSRDGLDMVSYLTLPAAADPEGDGKPNTAVPMVLYVHGGPWARDSWGFEPIHQLLANRGYAVLSVNYRGSTGFGKKFMNAGNLQWGKKMHDDLIDAVEWAVKAGVAPRDKIGILGGSYGGYATLAGLTLTPDVFACGVDIVGVSNLHTFIASIPAYWAPFLSVLYTRVGDPNTAEGKQLLTQSSPLTHAAKIKRPLLIGQGANDPRVKQAESEQIVGAMQKHRLPVTYALFPDEGHGFARPENSIAFFAITEAFLSAHLGGYYLPITKDELGVSSMKLVHGREGIPGLP